MITKEKLRAWGACWNDAQITETWIRLRLPAEVPPLRVARARSIRPEDRLWTLLRPEVLGDRLHPVLGQFIDRAIQHACRALDAAGVTHTMAGLPPATTETYEEIGAAASAAVWSAASAAASAAASDASAAASAASAASAATWDAAWYAASAATWGAAWSARAAWDAARAAWAAWDAAWYAELREQLRIVTAALKEMER